MGEGESSSSEVVRDALSSALGTALGTLLGGPWGEIVGAAAGPAFGSLAEKVQAEWARKRSVIAQEALTSSGLHADEFLKRMADSPEIVALVERVLFAARITANERKLRALGRVLGAGIRRDAEEIDDTLLMVDALTGIEGPHVLALVGVIEATNALDSEQGLDEDGNPKGAPRVVEIANYVNLPQETLVVALAGLVRYGLLVEPMVWEGPGYRPSAWGSAVAEVLRNIPDSK